MSEPKWTKGPWSVTQSDKARGPELFWITGNPGPMETEISVVHGGKPQGRSKANAHLIASAPTLYQELAEMVELFHGYQGMELTRAKVALAKARGETS